MTPSARLQAASELLDEIVIAARDNGASADALARKFFKTRRYAGSKDRRAIREHVYAAIRHFGSRPENGRAAIIGLAEIQKELAPLFDGSDYGPAPIKENESAAAGDPVAQWLDERFAKIVDAKGKTALLQRAPLDIRINSQKSGADEVLEVWPEAQSLALPHALRLPEGTAVEQNALYRSGKVEIQDLGSQAVVAAACVQKPALILDLCAGAGGKTMGLADQLPRSRIIAADTDKRRLGQIKPRLERVGVANVETRLLSPMKENDALSDLKDQCDLVLVDAPCSGTGTWRRNPELRWRMTPQRLDRTVALQRRLLDVARAYVRPGGHLIYAVCSLLDKEGADQANHFLDQNSKWSSAQVHLPLGQIYRKGRLLSPYQDGTDGFFFAGFEKPC